MRMITKIRRSSATRGEDGIAMIFAIMILLISSLLVAAAFVAANGDVKLTHANTSHKKAYYAALAGLAAYKYQLEASPYYWNKCPHIPAELEKGGEENREKVKESNEEEYVVKTVPAETSSGGKHTQTECESGKQSAIVQTEGGKAANTFRIESTGYSGVGYKGAPEIKCEGKAKKVKALACVSLIATFSHPGFLDYVYFTAYEILDPSAQNPEPTNCEHYYDYRKENGLTAEPPKGCGTIEFASTDKVNGPMHTNDAAAVCGESKSKPTFGRENHHDKIEMNEGHYAASGCKNEVNMLGEFTENGPTLTPPETDSELLESADDKFQGKTIIELKSGTPNTMKVITFKEGKEVEKTVPFPENGVMYVENAPTGCPIKYTPFNSDYTGDEKCGNVYVRGTYTESLTIAAANDVIINGPITTTHQSNGEPTGSAVLGLIATNFVRVYHPVKQGYTTKNVKPATEPPINGKCVKLDEANGKILKSTEVAEITTTGLEKGAEVEGTGIEPGTTISEIKASENKIKLSKAAKAKAKELSATIVNGSAEVEGVTTTELEKGDEVEGTGIEAGTTITETKAGNKIKLSKTAKTVAKELSAKIKSTTEVEVTTTNLAVGDEVEGSKTGQLEAGTKITGISGSKVTLNKAAKKSETTTLKFYAVSETVKLKFYGETVKLKFYVSTGYELNSALDVCHKKETGYSEYREAENLYVEKCETGSTYTSNAFCEYENNSGGCSSKVTNLDKEEDPRGWGSLTNLEVDAAILSTHHSFIVDNFKCGSKLGELIVWGSIAQFWRGPVGTAGGSGYIKDYTYDERLESNTPPQFLTPGTTAWKGGRVTIASPEFEP